MGGEPSAREYLSSLEFFGIKLGLSSIRALCQSLGNPERAYPTIHVGGTNGKGSVAAMIAAALQSAGLRTGRYTSPHLVHLEERFAIDGIPVVPAALDAAIVDVRAAVAKLQDIGRLEVHPTYFEVTTAIAFELFRRADVHCAVIEVGLGGQYDATNVVNPVAAAIVSISRDHEQHLGGSIAAIAEQKAGIAKPGVPLVVGCVPAEARAAIARICAERNAPLVDAAEGVTMARSRKEGRVEVSIRTPGAEYGPVVLGLRGDHQADNALVAVRVLEEAAARGLPVGRDAIVSGLERAHWPARLQIIDVPGCGRLLLDGAHNPAGAAALAAYVRNEWPAGLPLVFGAMSDKDIPGMLAPLRTLARPLIVTRAPGPRAAAVQDLAAAARAVGVDAIVADDLEGALAAAWSHSGTIAVAGSLFLAGRVLELLGPA
jgi:dihydrofolate synthase / folylpolyglutamate synthase